MEKVEGASVSEAVPRGEGVGRVGVVDEGEGALECYVEEGGGEGDQRIVRLWGEKSEQSVEEREEHGGGRGVVGVLGAGVAFGGSQPEGEEAGGPGQVSPGQGTEFANAEEAGVGEVECEGEEVGVESGVEVVEGLGEWGDGKGADGEATSVGSSLGLVRPEGVFDPVALGDPEVFRSG